MSLICLRHPRYDGAERPVLSCTTCCTLFIARLKERVQQGRAGEIDTTKWLEEKKLEAEARFARVSMSEEKKRLEPGLR